ncbi:hypothetical protein K466DRAFT_340642 [Polyporus arcularius HHB13444]|uniref:Uncharacterized protein n=1 Tax=Polyporus arcularius HHB13444 TaxID=1314778 RepID=A0A5C3PPX2_9APHY|nr:hypothetical protein K466DRAFT_340642 [Polyporus arcularius HHB13444]
MTGRSGVEHAQEADSTAVYGKVRAVTPHNPRSRRRSLAGMRALRLRTAGSASCTVRSPNTRSVHGLDSARGKTPVRSRSRRTRCVRAGRVSGLRHTSECGVRRAACERRPGACECGMRVPRQCAFGGFGGPRRYGFLGRGSGLVHYRPNRAQSRRVGDGRPTAARRRLALILLPGGRQIESCRKMADGLHTRNGAAGWDGAIAHSQKTGGSAAAGAPFH